ncbi:uncharacterized protein LOC135169513 [Diachasmimorpha longicaudata]|uniref:uncharacterized protein LOC135169513 n=1 Tax=Diachasmimorpha longicaudata TaxID=58733 RepID=UPI0030B887F7
MDEHRTISWKAASIALGSKGSGRKVGVGSSVGQSISPYFSTEPSQPLADSTNYYMETKNKMPFKCNVAMPRMISSKEVSRRRVMTRKTAVPADVEENDEDFFAKLMKNMDEDMKKNRRLPTISVIKAFQKKKSHCSAASLKLMNDFKESMKAQEATVRASPKKSVNVPRGQIREALPGQGESLFPSSLGPSQPPILKKISYLQKYDNGASLYRHDDLFDPPDPSKREISKSSSFLWGKQSSSFSRNPPFSSSSTRNAASSSEAFDLSRQKAFMLSESNGTESPRRLGLTVPNHYEHSPSLEMMAHVQKSANGSVDYDSEGLFERESTSAAGLRRL